MPAAIAGASPASATTERRRPDAVVLDPEPVLPDALVHGEARGVLALREPPSSDAVSALVEAFFDAWQHESLDALLALLTPDAGPLDGTPRGRGLLVESWRQRLRAHAYGRLAGVELVRRERIEHFEWEDLGGDPGSPRPAGMHRGELLVRAPVEVTRVAGEKLFGDAVTLVLRQQDGALRIAAYGETDAQ